MKREADFEMRPEYDFSGGVRGRHAARFTAEERDELVRRASSQDVQTWTAYSLLQVQELEAALFTYLVLAEKRSPEQAGAEAVTLLNYKAPVGLGQVLSSLRSRGLVLDELDQRLTFVSRERNWLVHRSGVETQGALAVPEKAVDLLKRLRHLVEEASALTSQITSLVFQHLSDTGLSNHEIRAREDETRGLWLAA